MDEERGRSAALHDETRRDEAKATILIPGPMLRSLDAIARQAMLSRSDVVRLALRRFLESETAALHAGGR